MPEEYMVEGRFGVLLGNERLRRQQRDTTTPQVYMMQRGRCEERQSGCGTSTDVRFYDAADLHQHDLGSTLAGDRGIDRPITVLL